MLCDKKKITTHAHALITQISPISPVCHNIAISHLSGKKKKRQCWSSLFALSCSMPLFPTVEDHPLWKQISPPQPHFYIFISSVYIHKITCIIVLSGFIFFYNCCICLFFHSHWYVFKIYPFGHMQLKFNLLDPYEIYWNLFIRSWTLNLLSLFSILNSMRMNIFLQSTGIFESTEC